MHKCTSCKKTFKSGSVFDSHSCVAKAMKMSRHDLLKRLLASGGCSQEYYDTEMSKLTQ